MSSIPSLDAVAQDFETWRSTKKTPRERTPLALCMAAAQLCSHYPTQHILSRLNISFNALKAFNKKSMSSTPPSADASSQSLKQAPPLSFFPVQLDQAPVQQAVACHIFKADGSNMVLHTHDPLSLLQAFLCSP